ncbi:MAG: NDP-sugar synthase [Elusimicrobiota bacterium]
MKAFVMSAGLGTRLRPLTFHVPKPMITIANKPVLQNTLELLSKHNVKDVAVNLHSFPEIIKKYFGNGEKFDINITYSFEKELLGTAGGVRKMKDMLDETFIVMSGDGLVDLDITEVLKFHKEKKTIATIVLKSKDKKFEYGVVRAGKDCAIEQFIEKPLWGDVFENRVNTGIYILEPEIFDYIPENKFYDFGHNVWPELLKKNIPIYAYEIDSYWCDIGNLYEYRKAQIDVMSGAVNIKIPGREISNKIWVGDNTEIDSNADLMPPCIIGNSCKINKGAAIKGNTVIGNNVIIDDSASIENCVIWDNVRIGKGSVLKDCIVGSDSNVTSGSIVYEGTIVKK